VLILFCWSFLSCDEAVLFVGLFAFALDFLVGVDRLAVFLGDIL